MALFERALHEQGNTIILVTHERRHRRPRAPDDPHPRRQDREGRAQPGLREDRACSSARAIRIALAVAAGQQAALAPDRARHPDRRLLGDRGGRRSPRASTATCPTRCSSSAPRPSACSSGPTSSPATTQWMEMMKRKRLTMDDMEAVQKACTLCSEVGAQVVDRGQRQARPHHPEERRDRGRHREHRPDRHRARAAGRAPHRARDIEPAAALVAVIGTGPVGRLLRHDGADRQGDRRRRPHAQGDRRRREEGRRVRREPGQLRVDADHDLPEVLRLAPLVQHPGRGARRWPSSRRRRTRCGWRCARAGTSPTTSPTTSASRPARASWSCGRR